MSLANRRPGCSSQRVWVRRILTGLVAVVGGAVVVSGVDLDVAAGVGVRAGRMEEVVFLGVGGNGAIPSTAGGLIGGEAIPAVAAGGGRIGGGIPGGGALYVDGAAGF